MVRVAAKPSRSALRPAKASGCPTAAVAFSATGSAPLQATSACTRRRRVCSTPAHRRGRLVCLRRGTFHRGKVPKTRRGLRPPDSHGAPRRASQEKASLRPLSSTGPSSSILLTPSRLRAGQWNRTAVTATQRFSKAARTAPEQGLDLAHGSFYAQISPSCRRGGLYGRPPGCDV